jgi:hypothetical protein
MTTRGAREIHIVGRIDMARGARGAIVRDPEICSVVVRGARP